MIVLLLPFSRNRKRGEHGLALWDSFFCARNLRFFFPSPSPITDDGSGNFFSTSVQLVRSLPRRRNHGPYKARSTATPTHTYNTTTRVGLGVSVVASAWNFKVYSFFTTGFIHDSRGGPCCFSRDLCVGFLFFSEAQLCPPWWPHKKAGWLVKGSERNRNGTPTTTERNMERSSEGKKEGWLDSTGWLNGDTPKTWRWARPLFAGCCYGCML